MHKNIQIEKIPPEKRRRREQNIGAPGESAGSDRGDASRSIGVLPTKLAGINAAVSEVCRRKHLGILPVTAGLDPAHARALGSAMWGEWMWGCNPTEDCPIDILLNRCHMLGLLLARYRGASAPPETRQVLS